MFKMFVGICIRSYKSQNKTTKTTKNNYKQNIMRQ